MRARVSFVAALAIVLLQPASSGWFSWRSEEATSGDLSGEEPNQYEDDAQPDDEYADDELRW